MEREAKDGKCSYITHVTPTTALFYNLRNSVLHSSYMLRRYCFCIFSELTPLFLGNM